MYSMCVPLPTTVAAGCLLACWLLLTVLHTKKQKRTKTGCVWEAFTLCCGFTRPAQALVQLIFMKLAQTWAEWRNGCAQHSCLFVWFVRCQSPRVLPACRLCHCNCTSRRVSMCLPACDTPCLHESMPCLHEIHAPHARHSPVCHACAMHPSCMPLSAAASRIASVLCQGTAACMRFVDHSPCKHGAGTLLGEQG
jgi:hypothetical protein